MSIHHSLDRLRAMRLAPLAEAIAHQLGNPDYQALSFEERVVVAVDKLCEHQEGRRLERGLKQAKLKVNAALEGIDYRPGRGLDRSLIASLGDCAWVGKSANVIVTGPTGVGKTHLGCALAQQAVRKGFTAKYLRLPRLLEDLEIAHQDGSLAKQRAALARIDLLILDDWAVAPLTPRGRQDLLELVDDRVGSGSVLITSQLPVDQWHAFIGDPTIADAILDRLVHSAHRIELGGESMRKRKA